jgi:hypothetical protein
MVGKTIHIAPDGEIETEPDAYAAVVAETPDGARLMEIRQGELDDGMRWIFYPDEDRYGWAMRFQNETDARLFVGLWAETGGFDTSETPSKFVPVPVVRAGRDAVAAYLLIGTGVKNSRQMVAQKLGVSEQAVSNYASRIRWKGEIGE